MEGERDLSRLLEALNPTLHAQRYSFSTATEPMLRDGQFALVREEEGLTLVAHDPAGEWARISLGVHSSLDAVGLTAALSSRLAERGISANMVAGLFHDHLFVPGTAGRRRSTACAPHNLGLSRLNELLIPFEMRN